MTVQEQIAAKLQTTVDKLDRRIAGMKLGDTCSRCGGCGEYSFNPLYGKRCFKCEGRGVITTSSKAAWQRCLDRVNALPAGAVDTYLESLRRKDRADRAVKNMFAAWYAWEEKIGIKGIHFTKMTPEQTQRNRVIAEQAEILFKAENQYKYHGLAVEQFLAVYDQTMTVIANA